MSDEKKDIVVTLVAREGNRFKENGETIGSHGRSIVFLPPGVKPDKSCRVKLVEIGRNDGRGRPMYRAQPAPVAYIDRWRDNGDGTASRITCSVNWLLEEREEGVNETRPLVTRETFTHKEFKYRFVCGVSLADSLVECTTIEVVHSDQEVVSPGGDLTWKNLGGQARPQSPETFAVKEISAVKGWTASGKRYLEVVYDPSWRVKLEVSFCYPDGSKAPNSPTIDCQWGELSAWLQAELMSPYPLCVCRRERLDNPAVGDYDRCSMCRNEETCDRCHAQPRRITLVAGRKICAACESMVKLELLVEEKVSAARRASVTAQARKLLGGKAVPAELGEAILQSTMDHFDQSHRVRDELLQRWAEYPWYYLCDDGVYGSKFSPDALELLVYYEQAKGDGLVTMTAWLVGAGHKLVQCERGDFYWTTQVRGEELALNLSSSDCEHEPSLFVRLRGSEQDRQAALTRFKSVTATLGEDSDAARRVRDVFLNEEQDYRAVLGILDELDQEVRQAELNEARRVQIAQRLLPLLAEHYPVCPLCNARVSWNAFDAERATPNYEGERFPCNCLNENGDSDMDKALRQQEGVHDRSLVQTGPKSRTSAVLVRQTRAGDRTAVEVFAFWKYGSWNVKVHLFPGDFGAGEWVSENVWQPPSKEVMELEDLRGQLRSYDDAERRAAETNSNVFQLSFRRGVNPKTEEVQWQAGNARQGIKYVVDRRCTFHVVEGVEYYCEYVTTLVETSTFKLVAVRPYLTVNKSAVRARIAELEAQAEAGVTGGSIEIPPEPVLEPASPRPQKVSIDVSKLSGLFGGEARVKKNKK